MRSSRPLFILIVALVTGCSGGGSSSGPAPAPATLVSITVAPPNPSISIGTSRQFAARGTYSDNSANVLTSSVTWSSSDTSIAAISNAAGSNGVATSVSVGTTTITAALGSTSAFTTLRVTAGGIGSTGNNVLSITVNGSLCSASTSAAYLNKPCVSVTVCNPGGTSSCQVIDDILLDTGSFGLRIFKQALTLVSLTTVTSGSGSLAECAQFGDGSAIWGPVKMASVILGNEPAVLQVPVQVGDSAFAAVPATCTGVLTGPADAFFNGILGVGVFAQDCGTGCSTVAGNGFYYTCTGSTCGGATVALSSQVQNPVALLPHDNNGVIVELPSVSSSGASSVMGSLVLGIGTQANNAVPSGVIAYVADSVGEIITTISGTTYNAIIDSGSNAFFFTPPSAFAPQLPSCASPNPGWFCPSSIVNIVATNAGATGSPSVAVSFEIGNFSSLISSNNQVFSNIGANSPGIFDWGLPFYFGRNVYVGIEGKGSSIGSGPYWAY
jgi:hypothetical protein